MRLLKMNVLALALVLLSASVASAITIRLENTADPNQVAIFLDMDAEAGTEVNQIAVGLQSADSDIGFVNTEAAPLLPIGQPGIMLSATFSWLSPTPSYGQASIATDVPAGSTRVLVDFFRTSTPTDGANSGNQNVLMATINYDAEVFAEYFELNFFSTGIFTVLCTSCGNVVPINDEVNLVNNLLPIPEPTTALLVGFGLVGLGVAGRRNV